MTDRDLVARKLARIEQSVRELRTEIQPRDILVDLRAQRFAQHTLQMAIQAALDVASHIVSDDRLGEPGTNRQLFEILVAAGWLGADRLMHYLNMVGFRNILVHGYEIADPQVVKEVVEERLGDLEEFVRQIRARIERG